MRSRLVLYTLSALFLLVVTLGFILYGKGYRLSLGQGRIGLSETGLLVVKSVPDGAQILINNHLTSATDNTISLSPAKYDIKIIKQGYFPWEKTVEIQKEAVSKIDALLFTKTPKLEGITDSGVANPAVDPSGTQIAFLVSSQGTRKNGVYILNMTQRPILTLQSASTQIVDDVDNTFSQSRLSWSPDGKQLLATIGEDAEETAYLLNATSFNDNPQDITATLGSITSLWEKQREDKEKSRIEGLKSNLKKIITEDFKIIAWSPDESKILYTASQSGTISQIIKPPLIGANPTTETRSIQKDNVYVYDIEEDKNYKIPETFSLPLASAPLGLSSTRLTAGARGGQLSTFPSLPLPSLSLGAGNFQFPLTWFPDSKHLIFVNDRKINIMEYDGMNKTTIYAGPFVDSFVFPWPDSSRLLILTDLGNTNTPPNLYTIGLK